VIRRAWPTCVALCACVASESGNPAQRCEDVAQCELGQVCYRAFCVDDGMQDIDPATGDDASAPSPVDATFDASELADSEPPRGEPDAGSGSRDAALPDGGQSDAGSCRDLCSTAKGQSGGQCKKCLETAFQVAFCDQLGDAAANNSLCIAHCLGAASEAPSCAETPPCKGLKCGGKP
jgi:hypothetical protein